MVTVDFSVLLHYLGGEDAWPTGRQDLLDELKQYNFLYTKLYSDIGKVTVLMKLLMQTYKIGQDN